MDELMLEIIEGLLAEVDDSIFELLKQKENLLETRDELLGIIQGAEPLYLDIHDYIWEQDDDD